MKVSPAKFDAATLTAKEQLALSAAVRSSAGNGHDFGFVEEIVHDLKPLKAQAVGALVSSLAQKGVFEVHEPVTTDSGKCTQFVFSKEVLSGILAIESSVAALKAKPAKKHSLAAAAEAAGVKLDGAPIVEVPAAHVKPANPEDFSVPAILAAVRARTGSAPTPQPKTQPSEAALAAEDPGLRDAALTAALLAEVNAGAPVPLVARTCERTPGVLFLRAADPERAGELTVAQRSAMARRSVAAAPFLSRYTGAAARKPDPFTSAPKPTRIAPVVEAQTQNPTTTEGTAMTTGTTVATEDQTAKRFAATLAKKKAAKANGAKPARKAAKHADGGPREPAGRLDKQLKKGAKAPKAPAAAKAPGEGRKPGVKQQLHAFFLSGKKGSVEQLMKITGAKTENNLKTALSDLKSDKYGVDGKAIKVEKDEKGVYSGRK